jgi:serine/threonine-protein kinase
VTEHSPSAEFLGLLSAVAGRYSLEYEIGRGGMGIVFLAHDVTLERPVAIKLLPGEMARQTTLRERFLREARTAAKLSHPNIIPIFSVEEVDEFVFIVMAYVEGETLGQRVSAKGPLKPDDATEILREVAWALAYAHAQGVIHRDVKPDNILLEEASGRVLVTDFGIAQVADSDSVDEPAEVLGTPDFMSPEQATGEPVDARSDIYSLGVTAFFAIAGHPPFSAPSSSELLAHHIRTPPPNLTSVAPAVPRSLASWSGAWRRSLRIGSRAASRWPRPWRRPLS